MSALAILSQPRKRSVVQISESRPGHFASIRRLPNWFGVAGLLRSSSCPSVPPSRYANCSTLFIAWIRGRSLATLIRLLGDLDVAEEAMHEAFAAALDTWPQAGVPDKPRPWLISTARFKAINGMRRFFRRGGSKFKRSCFIW